MCCARTLFLEKWSPGKILDPIPDPCTTHLAPTPHSAPNSCDYPKRWSIPSLQHQESHLAGFPPGFPPLKRISGSSIFPESWDLLLGAFFRTFSGPGQTSVATTRFRGNKDDLDELCDFLSNNFTQANPFWEAVIARVWLKGKHLSDFPQFSTRLQCCRRKRVNGFGN